MITSNGTSDSKCYYITQEYISKKFYKQKECFLYFILI